MDSVMSGFWIGIWLGAASAVAQTNPDGTIPAPTPRPEKPDGMPGQRSAAARQKASVAAQRQSVRRQAELAGTWTYPFDSAWYVDTPCDPIAEEVVAPIIKGAAQAQKVEPQLLRAVIDQESGFHPCAMSSVGAKGLMQLMPETADQFKVRDPFDPRQNIEAGASFLKQLLDRYSGDLAQALAAYNAGPRRVDEWGGIPDIPETRDYVESILARLKARDPEPPEDPKPKPGK
jgi:soluble lytic murein transglycosylase-like protein